MSKLAVITGSTRPGRFNIQPAQWIFEQAQQKGLDVELVDLADWNLPFLDEDKTPLHHQYEQDHTKKWATKIGSFDGYVFVTPEYNHSFSAVLKNAIDYLNFEWNYKPAAFVSYGSQAGGARAVEHLRGVLTELRMYSLKEHILLSNFWEHQDDTKQYQFSEKQVEQAEHLLEQLDFWAAQMKPARQKLQPI